jgi:hypothetical protein
VGSGEVEGRRKGGYMYEVHANWEEERRGGHELDI